MLDLSIDERASMAFRCPYCGTTVEKRDHTDSCPLGQMEARLHAETKRADEWSKTAVNNAVRAAIVTAERDRLQTNLEHMSERRARAQRATHNLRKRVLTVYLGLIKWWSADEINADQYGDLMQTLHGIVRPLLKEPRHPDPDHTEEAPSG
jgi:hypothetical protein